MLSVLKCTDGCNNIDSSTFGTQSLNTSTKVKDKETKLFKLIQTESSTAATGSHSCQMEGGYEGWKHKKQKPSEKAEYLCDTNSDLKAVHCTSAFSETFVSHYKTVYQNTHSENITLFPSWCQ